MNKLKGLQSVNYISIYESSERRRNLARQFKEYGIVDLRPYVYKRYEKGDYDIEGPFVDLMSPMSIGPTTSHLRAIKEWYENYDEEYAFFCEDDLSLETVEYWNFTWEDFINELPKNWEVVQLCLVTYEDIINKVRISDWQFIGVDSHLSFRSKTLNDWSAAAYVIKRSYAKKLIDEYYSSEKFTLDIKNTQLGPIVENILFERIGNSYCIPLFVEDTKNTKSTFSSSFNSNQGERHLESYYNTVNAWENYGKYKDIKELLKYKGLKVVQLGANRGNDDLFNYLNWYSNQLEFGLFVEPNINHLKSLHDCYGKYANAYIEQVAIKIPGDSTKELTIYYHTQDIHQEVASADINHVKKHEIYWYPGEIKSFNVPCITLEDLLDKYDVRDLDWLLIDVEGFDAEIISTFNWSKYNIKRVEFEHLHLGDRAQEIRDIFFNMGYKEAKALHQFDWAFEKDENFGKLNNFPPVNYVSLEESEGRRTSLRSKFKSFGVDNIVGHLFRKFESYPDNVTGPFVFECSIPNLGAATSHLKAIRRWYEETNEPYAFFCEDDISLETVKYWSFTWEEFFQKLPDDWEAVQLAVIRHDGSMNVDFTERDVEDWSACAYIIKREHAKKLIEERFRGPDFYFDMGGTNLIPAIEQVLFSHVGKVYSFPLFVEDTQIPSTYSKSNDQRSYHENSKNAVLNWWIYRGNKLKLEDIFKG